MQRINKDTVQLTAWEMVISDERENLLNEGYSIPDAVAELKKRHLELYYSEHRDFVERRVPVVFPFDVEKLLGDALRHLDAATLHDPAASLADREGRPPA